MTVDITTEPLIEADFSHGTSARAHLRHPVNTPGSRIVDCQVVSTTTYICSSSALYGM
jgi:hypothetical protein